MFENVDMTVLWLQSAMKFYILINGLDKR